MNGTQFFFLITFWCRQRFRIYQKNCANLYEVSVPLNLSEKLVALTKYRDWKKNNCKKHPKIKCQLTCVVEFFLLCKPLWTWHVGFSIVTFRLTKDFSLSFQIVEKQFTWISCNCSIWKSAIFARLNAVLTCAYQLYFFFVICRIHFSIYEIYYVPFAKLSTFFIYLKWFIIKYHT